MAVSSIGISGLPLEQLLKDLRNSENNALVLIQNKQVDEQNRVSAYGKIQASVEALQKAGEALSKADAFGALKTSVGGDSFTASADTKAIAGQYNIKVDSLASAQTLVSTGQTSRTDAIGADGSITLKLADGTTTTLDLTGKDTSIDGLVSAINSDPKLGVRATVVNDGSGTPYRLLLTANNTGTEAAVSEITVTGNDQLKDMLAFGGAQTSTLSQQAATNAKLDIGGITIISQSNTVEDAIEGVTLTLNKTTTEAQSLSVTRDDTVAAKAVTDFVAAYNSLQNNIKSLTSYDVDAQKGSALTGDSLARRVQTQMRDVLNVSSTEGAVRSLAQLGFKTDPTSGELSVDDKVLATALKDNLADVKSLLTGDNGVTNKLNTVASSFLGKTGLISMAKDGADRTLTDLDKQYIATSERIEAKMENYRKQFTALDVMVSQMNSVSSYLTNQLSMLQNLNSK